MGALIDFSCFIVWSLLTAAFWLIVAYVVSTWLVQFNVINMRNRVAYQIVGFLDAVSRALLRPLRRVVPAIGGVLDLSPFLFCLIVTGITSILLPAFHDWAHRMIGG
jgi:YggT family protein